MIVVLVVSSGNSNIPVIITNAKRLDAREAISAVTVVGCGTPATVTDSIANFRVTLKGDKYHARKFKTVE